MHSVEDIFVDRDVDWSGWVQETQKFVSRGS